MLSLLTPCLLRRVRSILFSPTTILAATWISVEAATPWQWYNLSRCSSSCWYSLFFARSRLWLSRIRARSLSFTHLMSRHTYATQRKAGNRHRWWYEPTKASFSIVAIGRIAINCRVLTPAIVRSWEWCGIGTTYAQKSRIWYASSARYVGGTRQASRERIQYQSEPDR